MMHLFLIGLLACRGPEPADESEPFAIELPTGPCGTEAHTWQPTDRLGEIVEWELDYDATVQSETADGLMALAGATSLGPALYDVKTYRVRYLTQDRGELVETTGLLSWPVMAPGEPIPTIVWAHPTVGFSDDCAPSGGNLDLKLGSVLLASLGYAVAAPDYLGMNGWGAPSDGLHPYLVPEPTAVATLDSVRALWRFAEETGESLPSRDGGRTVFLGASEGGFAALWADRYAAGYAPEIEVVGTVASVPPTDLVGLARHGVTVPSETTIGLLGFIAGVEVWHGANAPLSDVLTDEPPYFLATELTGELEHFCDGLSSLLEVDVTTVQMSDIYAQPYIDALQSGSDYDPWTCLLEDSTLRLSSIPRGHDAPVFMVTGEDDDLVNGAIERADVLPLCEAGYEIDYLECAGADHVTAAAASLPEQIQWAIDRLEGRPVQAPTCVVPPAVECSP